MCCFDLNSFQFSRLYGIPSIMCVCTHMCIYSCYGDVVVHCTYKDACIYSAVFHTGVQFMSRTLMCNLVVLNMFLTIKYFENEKLTSSLHVLFSYLLGMRILI